MHPQDLGEWAFALAGSPWTYLVVYLFATIDGFFPPVPSESVLIALAVLSASSGEPNVWLLGTVAAAGAFTGDQIAYSIGRRFPARRIRIAQSRSAQKAVTRAENALASRGAALIVGARFIPVGRVAVNMTAGAVGFSRLRFTTFGAVAAVVWSTYSVVVGVAAGDLLEDQHPLVGVAAGVAGGLLIGALVDFTLQRLLHRAADVPY